MVNRESAEEVLAARQVQADRIEAQTAGAAAEAAEKASRAAPASSSRQTPMEALTKPVLRTAHHEHLRTDARPAGQSEAAVVQLGLTGRRGVLGNERSVRFTASSSRAAASRRSAFRLSSKY